MRIYEQNPTAEHIVCPKPSAGQGAAYATRPLSACMDCPHFSYMCCNLPNQGSSRNSLQFDSLTIL